MALLAAAVSLQAQQPAPGAPGEASIRGTVLDAAGRPAAGATVHLQRAEHEAGAKATSVETTTDSSGNFVFSRPPQGNYEVTARNSAGQSAGAHLLIDDADKTAQRLILRLNDAGVQVMEFSDQPHFSVAGVSDYTAAGGHGSDITLRTSESLTNAATTLKPETPVSTPKATSASKQREADAHRLAGVLDEKRGDPLAAVREFEQAASLDPSEQNLYEWGSELLQHRAIWQAEQVFRRGAVAYPASLRMQAALGAALFAGARYDDAAVQFCKASDLDPADPEPYRMIGKVAFAAPKPLPCVDSKLARFVQLHPQSSEAHYLYAMAILKAHPNLSDSQTLDLATSSLNKAVELDSKCSEGYLELGILAAAHRDNDAAIGSYLKAIEANPQSADAHYRLAVAYDRIGEAAKAKQEFALHKQLEQQQAEATERQRKSVKQFLFANPDDPAAASIR